MLWEEHVLILRRRTRKEIEMKFLAIFGATLFVIGTGYVGWLIARPITDPASVYVGGLLFGGLVCIELIIFSLVIGVDN
jgi:hypothetical protein